MKKKRITSAAAHLAINGGPPVRKKTPPQKMLVDDAEARAVAAVLKSGRLTSLSNNAVDRFEKAFADYCGTKHCVAVNSGTAALHVALAAAGAGPGDEVVAPPYTFIATVSAIIQQNAVPVFADIDRETLNIDPALIEKKITRRTKAIVPVHLFGLPADMDRITAIAKRRGITVIEDACQAHGALYKGRRTGSMGDMACFSFQESKNMAAGEGGAIVTNSGALADKCRIIRHIGMAAKYEYVALGYNYRMPAMSAAVALAQLRKLDSFNERRARMADYYRKNLAGLPVKIYDPPAGVVSANHLFPVTLPTCGIDHTFEIYKALAAENVPVWWVYPRPLNTVEFIKNKRAYSKGCPFDCPHAAPSKVAGGGCPVADELSARTLVLATAPCYSEAVARDTVKAIRKVLPEYL
ncbi:MAG TPA: DegT/DnrJ/EryC1/StrS family aminotransferase [bacterium]|nr:DegT/DnrJ/EryC1/StrS family aminotransferase [bacterium]